MNELTINTATKINTLHNDLESLLHQGIEKAIEIGELLTAKKTELQHGEFGKWITDYLIFSDRTARNYMRLFENKDKVLTAGNISEAYKMLAEGKTETVSDLNGWNPEEWPEKIQQVYKIINKMKDGETVTGLCHKDSPGIRKADLINIKKYDEDYAYYELLFNNEDESGHAIWNDRPVLIEGLMILLSMRGNFDANCVTWCYPGMSTLTKFRERVIPEPIGIN